MILGNRPWYLKVDLVDVEDRMRPLCTLFLFIITTGLFTCTRWLEDVGWVYNSNRRLKSLSRKAPVSHPTSKTHGQSEGRFVDADAQKPPSMRWSCTYPHKVVCRQRQETSLSTPIDFPSRITIVVTIFDIALPEFVQSAPIRVPRILFASDRKDLFE
jgi:hypothetical protein